MIRVVARHEEDAESVLVGDFAPSEVRPLLELMDTAVIFHGEMANECRLSGTTQLVLAGPASARRYVLEVMLQDLDSGYS